ncbi:MAG: hypothetical protein SFU56_13575 [Capsulimonadales bacterium]|nr:hypothetical protein [Capsulimonadales bacterium]
MPASNHETRPPRWVRDFGERLLYLILALCAVGLLFAVAIEVPWLRSLLFPEAKG